MKGPASFVASVGPVAPEEVREIPGLEATISYWTGGEADAAGWLRETERVWGQAAFAMWRGDKVHGFVLYGPAGCLPRAGSFPVGPLAGDEVLMAYVGGDRRTRRHLMVRMLKDLRGRGVCRVEAIAADFGTAYHVPTRVLVESGWRPLRRFVYRGRPYTHARIDLGSAVEVGELARGIIGKVRLPGLNYPAPVPGVLSVREPARMGAVGSRS